MTSIEWFFNEIKHIIPNDFLGKLKQAKEMHKQEIIDAYSAGEDNIDNDGCSIGRNGKETYYQETFVSKGSDELTKQIIDFMKKEKEQKQQLPQQEISDNTPKEVKKDSFGEISDEEIEKFADESWEGCDGCTEQDEIMYKNGYVKGYNAAIAELPKEISDEQIEKAARDYDNAVIYGPPLVNFEQGAFWYREQLKSKE